MTYHQALQEASLASRAKKDSAYIRREGRKHRRLMTGLGAVYGAGIGSVGRSIPSIAIGAGIGGLAGSLYARRAGEKKAIGKLMTQGRKVRSSKAYRRS